MLEACVLEPDALAVVTPRLQNGQGVVQLRSADVLPALDAGTARQVYFVEAARLGTPEWSRLRTRFAQLSRAFIVFGTGLDTRQVVRACRDGAFDVVDTADVSERWLEAGLAAAESQSLWLSLYGGAPLDPGATLVGVSDALLALRRTVERIGPTPAAVLLMGEPGVGKQKVAQALHRSGSQGPFVVLPCGSLPANLIEAELFGRQRSEAGGADVDRPGLVEQAAGGTLLLDDVEALDLSLQSRLLRFLETRRAHRVGSSREYTVEVRVISTTTRALETEVAAGRFRSDLYFQLAEVTLRIPSLRQRPADVPLLARYFLSQACERFGKFFDAIEPSLLLRWQAYAWPGNLRELKGTVDRLVLLHDGPVLRDGWWEAPASPGGSRGPGAAAPGAADAGERRPLSRRDRLQRARQLLAEPGHELAWVAAQVGVHPTTLFRWRKSGRL